jgi:hypothetical protein
VVVNPDRAVTSREVMTDNPDKLKKAKKGGEK